MLHARRALVTVLALAGAFVGSPSRAQLTAAPVVTDLSRPVSLTAPPGDDRLFIVELGGTIRVTDRDGTARGTFLDLTGAVSTGSERGLLGLAFAPDYATSGRFYVSYTDGNGDSQLMRYRVGGDPDRADPASATRVLTVAQPASNHNGGDLAFGPDGMLYFGLGDGGGSGDLDNNAQNDQSLLGKLLRLDVSGNGGYTIPPDNPFVGQAPRDEIWAKGLRNPWRWSFDRSTGDLYLADVGQGAWEELNVQPAGAAGGRNYGWRLMEGDACYNPSSGCDPGGLTGPVFAYAHSGDAPVGCSITGGFVYRGAAIPAVAGQYFFADFCTARLWSVTWDGAGGATGFHDWTDVAAPAGGFGAIAGFGQDGRGELYVLDYGTGIAYRLEPTGSDVPRVGSLQLGQNAPNPFNPDTTIRFRVDPQGGPYTLRVYDLAGRLVRDLDAGAAAGDTLSVVWDGRDHGGRPAPAGVYRYRLAQDGGHRDRTMVLLK